MTDKERERQMYEYYKPIYDEWIKLYPFTTEDLDGEIWKVIPNFEDYHGSNFGRVKSFKNGKEIIRRPVLHSKGYLFVAIYKDGKQKKFRVHRLVAMLFIPNPLNLPEVNHDDGCKLNCYVGNLYWSTHEENIRHAVRTELIKYKKGEEHHKAKLTNEQVLYIRENPDGLNTYQLAEKFGVAQIQVSRIQRGKSYKQSGGIIRQAQKHSIITNEMREKILARYQAGGISQRALAKEFGVGQGTVCNIVNGK